MTKIKLCGLFRKIDIDYANEAQPDFVGFVFVKDSPRYITLKKALQFRQRLNANIPAVGVFRDAPFSEMVNLYQLGVIQYVQLHGHESEQVVNRLKQLRIPIIRAFSYTQSSFVTSADYVLIDGMKPGSGGIWPWKKMTRPTRPFFLAGGLTPDNVTDAIQTVHPNVIDVSSGIETQHVKDFQKMIKIVRSVHNARN